MKLSISMEVEIPKYFAPFHNASKQQQNEWIKFNLGDLPEISLDNPLHDYALLEDVTVTYWSIPNE